MEVFLHKKNDFKDLLYNESKKINIELNNEQLEQFEKYKELLVEWNTKMNLTAITEDYEVIMKHFIDSLEVVKYIKEDSKIIDVGTGAGFPGIVVSIYFNRKVKITLMDALNKRINFLNEIIKELNLSNVEVVHARAEELSRKEEYREKYDYALSRAVAPLNILLEYDIPFVKINGKCLLLKGSKVDEEINNSKKALDILKSDISNIYEYSYIVDNDKYKRSIVEITKEKSTNEEYPRNYGRIKKKPL